LYTVHPSNKIAKLCRTFNAGRVEAIVTKHKLDDLAGGGAHGAVVLDAQVLEALDQSALHVARLGRLHGRVHQPLPAGHGVEEELGGGQPVVEAVLYT